MATDRASAVGSPDVRREDPTLLAGEARFTGDLAPPGTAHLAVARSQHAHARLEAVDTAEAAAVDGVLAVFTATDLAAADVPNVLPSEAPPDVVAPDRPVLATDRVRFQGEPIAVVVAEDAATANTAADRISGEYDRVPAVTEPGAVAEDGPPIHATATDNVAVEYTVGDAAATDEAFEAAAETVSLDLDNQRVLAAPMEPGGALADFRPADGTITLDVSSQNPHDLRGWMADWLSIPAPDVRVRVPAVGGGFGAKTQPYPAHFLAAWCSRRLGRPVVWQASRTEDSDGTIHGRGIHTAAELALDDEGNLLGLRGTATADLGAYLGHHAAAIATDGFGRMLPGAYDLPAFHLDVTGAFTNETPLSAYRGAGRPESTYVIERLLHAAARAVDADPTALRRRNFIPAEAFPYETVGGHTYDSGDYAGALARAEALLDYEALRDRQGRLRDEGRYLGIGFSCYVDAVGGAPGDAESALCRVTPGGDVVVFVGPAENGQGHRTTYAQIAADELGLDPAVIRVRDGDTDSVPESYGTGGSRSIPIGGSAVVRAAERVREQARAVAAHALEAAPADLEFADGSFQVRGAPDRRLTLTAVAERAHAGAVPDGQDASLEASATYDPSTYTYPFGAHAAVVEVDPATGDVTLEDYVAVTDVGVQINPRLVEGQVHGGVVQGIGQALWEGVTYDDNGNHLTGSFQDYALPRAANLPEIRTASTETPCPHNPLGAKGVGESGAIAATPAVVNATVDALEPFGVGNLRMPLTAERVWTAIHGD